MNILVLMDRFLPHVGGSINWMINAYSRWPWDRITFAVPKGEENPEYDSRFPFDVFRISMKFTSWDPMNPRIFWEYVRCLLSLKNLCRAKHIQQIHCAKVLPEGLLAWCLHRALHIPYILYAHGEEILFSSRSRLYAWLLPKIYNGAAGVIANSRNTEELLVKIGVKPIHIHVIHPGVDIQRFFLKGNPEQAGLVRKQYHLETAAVLLTVGRLQKRKGHDMVIRALPGIMQKFPNVRYIIVGEGEERDHLERLAEEKGVTGKVVFAGNISDKDLPGFYAMCDVFVMPNREIAGDIEGFGMVFLEANAAGKPVIGGESGGTSESIRNGETGFRINGEDLDELTERILHLLASPEMATQLGREGQRWVCRELSWEAVAERTHQVVAGIS